MHSHQYIRNSLAAAFLLAALALAFALLPPRAGAAFNSSTNSGKLPSLNGQAAVEHLRQQGLYSSLAEAVAAARVNAQLAALIDQQTKLTAGDGSANDRFGYSVAISGNTAVVGAFNDTVIAASQGSAYVFVLSGGLWTQQARLNATDGAVNDGFGFSVAISGETVAVGSYGDDSVKGSAYVFVRSGATWSQQQKLTAADGVANDAFGVSVAISGDTLVVGAVGDSIGANIGQGSAYVFLRSSAVWSQQQKLASADGAANDQFGRSVAISGETVVVGASGDTVGANGDQGSAYVFVRDGATWGQQQKLTSADGGVLDQLGGSVAISGDTLVVGAAGDSIGANQAQGSAYVFVCSGTTWSQQQKLSASDGAIQDLFGYSVAISGSTVIVGSPADDIGVNTQQGSAYVFTRNGAAWSQQSKLTAQDGTEQVQFGNSVAISGDTLMVGASGNDIGANQAQGSAYVFVISGNLAQQQILEAADGGANDNFGVAVAVSGNTAVVGSFLDDIGASADRGSAYVFVRNGVTWTQQAKLTASDGVANDYFGNAVAISGETVVVGAYGDDSSEGAVYVFTRNGALWSQQQKISNGFGAPGDRFGISVALSGNTLAIGADGADLSGKEDQGVAFTLVRNGATWNSQALLTAADGAADDRFGISVGISGDTVVVGSPSDDVGVNGNQGSAYIFARSGVAWSQQQKLTAADGGPGDFFGGAVALDGDTAVIGDSADDSPNQDQGSAYVFVRSGATWSQQQKLTAADGAASDYFGHAVAISNDMVVIGAYNDFVISAGQGSTYVFARNGAAWTQQQKLIAGNGAGDRSGYSVAISGDTVVVGVQLDDRNTNSNQGTAYVFAGVACPALTVNPDSPGGMLPEGTVGNSYSQIITASGGTAPYDFIISFGALPPGVTLSTTGLLSGTPVIAGTFNFTITATASTLCPGSRAYTIVINGNCPAITVNPANPALLAGQAGQAYSQMFAASGGALGYSFAITAGGLPAGLMLSAAGVLSGAPLAVGNFSFTVRATDNNGCVGARSYTLTINNAVANAGLQFYPLAHPIRLLDTRPGQIGCDAPGTAITGNTSRNQTAAGRTCGGLVIPADAKALTGNITTVQSDGGYLTLYPSDAAQPLVANTNYAPNEIINNVFTVGLGAGDGAFNIFALNTTHVVVDVTGYYAPPSADGLYFHPLPKPIRLLETRAGQRGCYAPGVALQGNADTPQVGQTACGGVTIPAAARALVGNATTVNPATSGYLTLYPAEAPRPLVASANFTAGQIINSPFTVALSAVGEFMIFTTADTDLVIDVLGYYSAEASDANGAGLLFNPLPQPVRLLETRAGQAGCYKPNAPLLTGSVRNQQARGVCGGQTIAANALAIVGNATVVNAQAGYLTFWPNGTAQPLAATSNFAAGQALNRHFTVGLGATGMFNIFAFSQTDLVIDVVGFFAP